MVFFYVCLRRDERRDELVGWLVGGRASRHGSDRLLSTWLESTRCLRRRWLAQSLARLAAIGCAVCALL